MSAYIQLRIVDANLKDYVIPLNYIQAQTLANLLRVALAEVQVDSVSTGQFSIIRLKGEAEVKP